MIGCIRYGREFNTYATSYSRCCCCCFAYMHVLNVDATWAKWNLHFLIMLQPRDLPAHLENGIVGEVLFESTGLLASCAAICTSINSVSPSQSPLPGLPRVTEAHSALARCFYGSHMAYLGIPKPSARMMHVIPCWLPLDGGLSSDKRKEDKIR